MNKTQDKFSLPAVTLSIFAAAGGRASAGMQFVPGTPLAGGAGCSTADDTFCFGQSVLAVRPAKAAAGQLHFACRSG